MGSWLKKKAYNDMVALYDDRSDDFTYNLLGNDTEQSIFHEVKRRREFKSIKHELSIKTFHARICQKSLL